MNSPGSVAQTVSGTGETAAPLALPARLASELFAESGAGELGFSPGEFEAVILDIARKYLAPPSNQTEVTDFCRTLRVADIALARACAAGREEAWGQFFARHRESLHRSALAITGDADAARELADSVYAELYGLRERDGQRASKLVYYDGRGSLDGWLRSVLAHEHLNQWRDNRKLVSLEEQVEAGCQFPAPDRIPERASDSRLDAATDEALTTLSAEERYLLASYYLDGQTLAEIASLLNVHESTISRRLNRLTSSLNKKIVRGLRQRGMSKDQAQEAIETDARDLAIDVRRHVGSARSDSPAVLSTGADQSR